MPIKTKSIDQSADKWSRRASVAGDDYRKGVQGSGAAWEAGARAGADNWKTAITQAASRDAFSKGIANAGASKFETKTLEKGPNRFSEGVSLSLGDYMKSFSPFLTAIQNLSLPPRRPSGDPGNLQRVAAVDTALAQLKRR